VSPDIDGLVVKVEEGAERMRIGALRLAIAGEDKGIIATPGRKVIPEEKKRMLDLGFNVLSGINKVLCG
jgi:hypothetical protein